MTDLPNRDIVEEAREHRTRFRWLGGALVVAGILAIVFPFFASLAATAFVGWMLIVMGAVTLWNAVRARGWRQSLLSGAAGLLSVVVGAYLAFVPLGGLLTLTVALGLLFGAQGAIEIAMGARMRPGRGWGWMVASGAASILLALLVILGLPGSALWALGLILGVNFISTGVAFLALARVA